MIEMYTDEPCKPANERALFFSDNTYNCIFKFRLEYDGVRVKGIVSEDMQDAISQWH